MDMELVLPTSVSDVSPYLGLEGGCGGFDVRTTVCRSSDGSCVGSPLSQRSVGGSSRGSPVPPPDTDEIRAEEKLHHWVAPSGPRQQGLGTEELEQGVISVEPSPTGGIQLRITLLAAGFVIGPSGASIRDVCRATGADIRSWTTVGDGRCRRPTRTFRVEGLPPAVRAAATIVADAVERYKDLCEGAYAGQSVSRIQRVHSVEFAYQPPPRSQVPNAATLKGPASRRNRDRQGSLARRDGDEAATDGQNRGVGNSGTTTGVAAAGATASPSSSSPRSDSRATLSRSMVLGHLATMLPPEQPSGLLQAPALSMGLGAPSLDTALSQLLSSSVKSPADEPARYLEALALLTAQQKASSLWAWGSNASGSYSLATSPLDVASMLMARDAMLCGPTATNALVSPPDVGNLATSVYAQQLIALQLLAQPTNGLSNMMSMASPPTTTTTGFAAPGFDTMTLGGWAALGGASASAPGWLS